MNTTADIIVRDAYLTERDSIADIAVGDGRILAIGSDLAEDVPTELDAAGNLVTDHGANLLGLKGYGIEKGTPADPVVHDSSSPQWAIVENSTPRYVLKEGQLVAEDGNVVGQ
ncbi:hypothetical protein [Haladaptatus sp. CMAA 1911]|uniref:hypothetical protein n=1 Tax=unclassified Haladaptatus TaxID=2622732 RepID=UPI003754FCEA